MPKSQCTYNKRIANRLCNAIIKGDSTVKACQKRGMPSRMTVSRWIQKYPEFRERYYQAKQLQTHFTVDTIREIAEECDETNNASVQKAKLLVDTIKWEASKMLPQLYGERKHVELETTDGPNLAQLEEVVGKVMKKYALEAETIDG